MVSVPGGLRKSDQKKRRRGRPIGEDGGGRRPNVRSFSWINNSALLCMKWKERGPDSFSRDNRGPTGGT